MTKKPRIYNVGNTHTHKVVCENWTAMYSTMRLEFSNPIYKFSKCIKDLI